MSIHYHVIFFYRATLCVSAVFDVVRCPSVRPSVTVMYCIQTAEDIVKLLSRPVSPIVVYFDPECRYPIPMKNPSAGAPNSQGWKNLRVYLTMRRYPIPRVTPSAEVQITRGVRKTGEFRLK